MDPEELRDRCRARLGKLDLPRPFDVHVLCDRLGQRRGRPIVLVPLALPPHGPCGLWINGQQQDYIVYEQTTSPLHQEHIVLHEVAHLVCEHPGAPQVDDAHSGRLFTNLDPAMVRRVLARTSYSTDEEIEAELLASLILQHADRRPLPRTPIDPRIAQIVRRLESNWGLPAE